MQMMNNSVNNSANMMGTGGMNRMSSIQQFSNINPNNSFNNNFNFQQNQNNFSQNNIM